MSGGLASRVDRGRPNALEISQAVEIAGKLGSYAVTPTVNERNLNGKQFFSFLLSFRPSGGIIFR